MKHKQSRRTGQVWTMDFILGLIMFIFLALVAVRLLTTTYDSGDYGRLYREAVYFSDNIVSSGYPGNWTTGLVMLPGVVDDSRLNVSKLQQFSQMDYYATKSLFHITSDYIFFIQNATSTMNMSRCVYGYNILVSSNCSFDINTVSHKNLVRIDRIVAYNSTLVRMVIYAWN